MTDKGNASWVASGSTPRLWCSHRILSDQANREFWVPPKAQEGNVSMSEFLLIRRLGGF